MVRDVSAASRAEGAGAGGTEGDKACFAHHLPSNLLLGCILILSQPPTCLVDALGTAHDQAVGNLRAIASDYVRRVRQENLLRKNEGCCSAFGLLPSPCLKHSCTSSQGSSPGVMQRRPLSTRCDYGRREGGDVLLRGLCRGFGDATTVWFPITTNSLPPSCVLQTLGCDRGTKGWHRDCTLASVVVWISFSSPRLTSTLPSGTANATSLVDMSETMPPR